MASYHCLCGVYGGSTFLFFGPPQGKEDNNLLLADYPDFSSVRIVNKMDLRAVSQNLSTDWSGKRVAGYNQATKQLLVVDATTNQVVFSEIIHPARDNQMAFVTPRLSPTGELLFATAAGNGGTGSFLYQISDNKKLLSSKNAYKDAQWISEEVIMALTDGNNAPVAIEAATLKEVGRWRGQNNAIPPINYMLPVGPFVLMGSRNGDVWGSDQRLQRNPVKIIQGRMGVVGMSWAADMKQALVAFNDGQATWIGPSDIETAMRQDGAGP